VLLIRLGDGSKIAVDRIRDHQHRAVSLLFGQEITGFRQRQLEMVAWRGHQVRTDLGHHLLHDRGVLGRRQDKVG